MSTGGIGADDVYEVVFQVDDSDEARAVAASIARQQRLHAQWQSTMNAMNQAARSAADSTGKARTAMDALNDAVGKVGDGVQSLFRGLAESTPALLAVRAITAAMAQGVEEATQLADKTQQMRDLLRDIVGIQGGGGVGARPLAEHLQLMQQAGLTSAEAHGFREQFLGEAEAYKDRMKPEEYEQLQSRSARMAMAYGLKPETMALLSGRLISRMQPGAKATDVIGQAGEVQRLLQAGSGVTSKLMESYLQSMATLTNAQGTGQVGGPRQLAALAMGASRLGPESTVDTTLENFAKAVTGLTRNKDWTRFIREDVGIKEGTTAERGMVPLFQRLEKEQAQGRDLMTFLAEQGLKDTQARRSVVGMYGQRDILMRELNRPEAERVGAAQVEEKVTEAYEDRGERGRVLRRRQAEAKVTAAEVEVGKDYEEAQTLRREAYANLLKRRELGPETKADQAIQDFLSGKAITNVSEQQRMIEREAYRLGQERFGMVFEGAPFAEKGGQVEGGKGMGPDARGAWTRRIQGFELAENIKRAQDSAAVGDRSRMVAGIGPQGEALTAEEARKTNRLMQHLVDRNERMLTQPRPGNQVQP